MQTTEQARANLETARALLGRSLAGVRNARYLFNGTPMQRPLARSSSPAKTEFG